MKIESFSLTVFELFDKHKIFQIPRYQRSYAWTTSEVDDFITDLKDCYQARKNGTTGQEKAKSHFFGGIVSVEKDVEAAHRHTYDVVDGQQRLATFILLVSSVIKFYEKLKEQAVKEKDAESESFCLEQINILKGNYITYKTRERSQHIEVKRFMASKIDTDFFIDLINNNNPELDDSIASHKRLLKAKKAIDKAIKAFVDEESSLTTKIEVLIKIEDILSKDYLLLHIITSSREEAYTLFQVLNDRGTNLTNGDLIKANVLEALEQYPNEQNSVEKSWDQILSSETKVVEDNLQWIYSSKNGERAKKAKLHKEFTQLFYPIQEQVDQEQSIEIRDNTQKIVNEFELCNKYLHYHWPFQDVDNVKQWDKYRLYLLINVLDNKASIPLLLAAQQLGARKFADLVHLLEKFFFRYKIICNGHASALIQVYNKEAKTIRDNPATYNINQQLKKKLNNLLQKSADDETFKNLLPSKLKYESSARKAVKYFLTTVDYYLSWYNDGAQGSPQPKGLNRIYDFESSTIEHVYPQKPEPHVKDLSLEPLVNTLGNLSFFDTKDNATAGNKAFNNKKDILKDSMLKMNIEIADNSVWDVATIQRREKKLIEVALKVFSLS
ncbi:DUF262 domain-containing protein [Microscilla marina]|uniref:DUF262 domain-containing protein n=1 Tax=Microscilla marina ATCC 23134 TaxID=313606 RepID=A1ZIK1_MICM2|nr:DUF262 domain-containing protein [Microscilla marina]EAY29869.1 protein of unknown function [Microscilla marina ATCC 23134]